MKDCPMQMKSRIRIRTYKFQIHEYSVKIVYLDIDNPFVQSSHQGETLLPTQQSCQIHSDVLNRIPLPREFN